MTICGGGYFSSAAMAIYGGAGDCPAEHFCLHWPGSMDMIKRYLEPFKFGMLW
jgi:hypothetical protein